MKLIKLIKDSGHTIGIHPSYFTWKSAKELRQQKISLESATKTKVQYCRQHWLKFSWKETWAAQGIAEIKYDSTLMFNDKPGFRSGGAIAWEPWNHTENKPHKICQIPTILMDSHLYDYKSFTDESREKEISRWMSECYLLGGVACVLWHPHTLSTDYGWEKGLRDLLKSIKIQDLEQEAARR